MLENHTLEHTLYAIAIIVASAILGRVVKFLLNTVFKMLFKHTTTTLDDLLLDVMRGKVTTLCIIGGVYIAIEEVKKGLLASHVTALQGLQYLTIALYLVLVFVLTRLIVKVVQTTFDWYFDEVSKKTNANITPTIAPLTTKLINILLFMTAGMIVLDHFGINIGSFLVSLGVGSLAVALAAQETVANMIAGFVILVDQPFRIGDRIMLPTGEQGDVIQIGLRSTRIIAIDNNMVIIPNSDLVKNRIINYTYPSGAMRSLIDVNVAYNTDIQKAKAIIAKIIREQSGLSEDFPITILVNNLGESSIVLRIVVESTVFKDRFEIESNIRERILKEFAASNIEIPYPQRVIHIANPDGFKAS